MGDGERYFRAAFDQAPIGMAVISLAPADRGRFRRANSALADLTGYPLDAFPLLTVDALLYPEERAAEWGCLDRLAAGGADRDEREQRLRSADGREIWAATSSTVVPDGAERHLVFRHYVDVTAARHHSALLVAANEELWAANQVLRDFVGIASHELKTPLTTVAGFASILATDWEHVPEEQRRDFVRRIDRQARRLTALVNDLLAMSRIDSGVLDARLEKVEVAAVVADALSELPAVNVAVQVPPDLSVLADRSHLQQILVNYLTNAVKHGAPPFSVEAAASGEHVEIRVADHGRGVPEAFVPRLFARFAQADMSASRHQEGSGLGLAIVRGLAGAQGGEAFYRPRRGGGSCFGVRLARA